MSKHSGLHASLLLTCLTGNAIATLASCHTGWIRRPCRNRWGRPPCDKLIGVASLAKRMFGPELRQPSEFAEQIFCRCSETANKRAMDITYRSIGVVPGDRHRRLDK
ncbi:uncharacterized protein EV422DRAFT_207515 [Fimicolochytrium jonesii]|uniref:uncharacterized protein n=1 Tax=Fimicolochytrium jonesii TaxID=1396493 RepID=UPI0022FF208D|nr:uncharacterized protein EV422DRAFT_207515 [Fimicolochytrium jonesii]KAI8817835.1 hypothetical protein EV422DRAFT_207515 [Fimicolochytrium jonesii]